MRKLDAPIHDYFQRTESECDPDSIGTTVCRGECLLVRVACGSTKRTAESDPNPSFAELCRSKRLFAAAARFYHEAVFGKAPLTAGGVRYDLACVAALAGCGQGEDAGALS